jgi:hypothetical protein
VARGKREEGLGGGGDFLERDEAEGGVDFCAARAGNGVAENLAAGGAREDFAEALAAVGERAEVGRAAGMTFAQRAGGDRAGLARGERVLEFVEREKHAHRRRTWRRRSGRSTQQRVEVLARERVIRPQPQGGAIVRDRARAVADGLEQRGEVDVRLGVVG